MRLSFLPGSRQGYRAKSGPLRGHRLFVRAVFSAVFLSLSLSKGLGFL